MAKATAATPHQRWLRKLARDTDRKRLEAARRALRDARAAKRTARARARSACARARAGFKRWVKAQRAALQRRIAALRLALRTRIDTRRARLKACCGAEERARVRAASDARIAAARAELDQLQRERRRERVWARKDPHAAPIATRAREAKQESDHEVEVNLSPDELIVWRQVRRQIRGSDRMSRTEAFQHWMHDHSSDVARIIAEDAELAYRQALRDEQKQRAAMRSTRTDKQLRRYVAAELDAVPF